MKLPLIRADVPDIEEWVDLLSEPYRLRHYSNSGFLWNELTKKIIDSSGCISAIGVANNTVGQVAALHAIDIHNELVFISNFTFPATLQAVIMAGGSPVLCDVDEDTWEVSLSSVMKTIKKFGKPKAVILTRVFGQRHKHENLVNYLEEENIKLIFDSAAAFPVSMIDENMKNLTEVYSLHATKAFGIGEGGLITGPKSEIEKIWKHSNFGFQENMNFEDGSNAKMDEFSAARAIAALENLGSNASKRMSFVRSTYANIFDESGVKHLDVKANQLWSLFPIKFESRMQLEIFQRELLEHEIFSKKYYSPSMLTGYKGKTILKAADGLLISEDLAQTVLCLPVYSQFTEEESQYLRDQITSAKEKL
jgi:dTDP-4-amino-4,6-dideoxygalactose transaminase